MFVVDLGMQLIYYLEQVAKCYPSSRLFHLSAQSLSPLPLCRIRRDIRARSHSNTITCPSLAGLIFLPVVIIPGLLLQYDLCSTGNMNTAGSLVS